MIRLSFGRPAPWALLLACALTFPAMAPAQSTAARINTDALRAGDAVRITVWQKPEMSGEFIVTGDGTLASPFFMGVSVVDMPFATAAQRLREHVEKFERTNMVLVEPLLRISVGGEVRTPTLVMTRPETTIAQVIMLAGGPTDRANLGKVKVLRANQQLVVDLNRPSQGHATTLVQSGDLIVVPRKT